MSKKVGIACILLGTMLILSASFLYLNNEYKDYCAGQTAELLMCDIQSAISEARTASIASNRKGGISCGPLLTDTTAISPTDMSTLLINGYEYIGYLSIPDLELNLPVMAQWDYYRLDIAPCRHFGSTKTDDLVIAAHNYKSHFGFLPKLEIGAEIIFTDMDGTESLYALIEVSDSLSASAVREVQDSEYDLVLYTCTPGGATRHVAFFDRVPIPLENEIN